jgi:hypothetical protein
MDLVLRESEDKMGGKSGYVAVDDNGVAHVTTSYEQAEEYGQPMKLTPESMERADDLLGIGIKDVVRHDQGAKDL